MRNKFSEFKVRYVWCKTNHRLRERRTPLVITEHLHRQLCSMADVYWSIARYPLAALKIPNPTVNSELEYVSSFFVDIDAHDSEVSVFQAARTTNQVHQWLVKRLHIQKDQVVIWFSGRGFHLAVAAEILLDHPKCYEDDIENDYKAFADLLVRESQMTRNVVSRRVDGAWTKVDRQLIDMSLYKRNGLIRVPGSIHTDPKLKAVNRKFRISADQLSTLVRKHNAAEFNSSFKLLAETPFLSWEEWI